jgi:hypothetical protein
MLHLKDVIKDEQHETTDKRQKKKDKKNRLNFSAGSCFVTDVFNHILM